MQEGGQPVAQRDGLQLHKRRRCTRDGMKHHCARLLETVRAEGEVYRPVLADQRCPRAARWLLGSALAYALSPVDIIPDFMPIVGNLDDVVLMSPLVWLALRAIPEELIDEHRIVNRRDGSPIRRSVS